jgi:class 3 adenylate cyclase
LLLLAWEDDILKLPYASEVKSSVDSNKAIFKGIRIRMGIHVGFPNCRRNPITGRMDYFGPVVNRSARVSDSAHGGQIVCTNEVKARIDLAMAAGIFNEDITMNDLGTYKYKGIHEEVRVFMITGKDLEERIPHFPELRIEKKDDPKENDLASNAIVNEEKIESK